MYGKSVDLHPGRRYTIKANYRAKEVNFCEDK